MTYDAVMLGLCAVCLLLLGVLFVVAAFGPREFLSRGDRVLWCSVGVGLWCAAVGLGWVVA